MHFTLPCKSLCAVEISGLGLVDSPGYHEGDPQLLSLQKWKKNRTPQNPWLFAFLPTGCMYLET